MSTPEELHALLMECGEKLVDCAGAITDLPMDNHKQSVYKIGKAIAEVAEVRSSLYEFFPHLKPELWDKEPSENHYREWFLEAERVALEYCNDGKPEKAVSTFESYISIGPAEKYAMLAKQSIKKVKDEYGV
jgi:hypothetical protein